MTRFLISLMCIIAGTIDSSAQIPDSIRALFQYVEKVNQYDTDSSYVRGQTQIERITYTAPGAFKVSSYVTYPLMEKGKAPFILFNHWGEGTKEEFLSEAISLSDSGFICMLPDEPWLCPGTTLVSFKRQGHEMIRQAVLNDRTAIDLAEAKFKINPSRIYFVGHSFGTTAGAILSAIENRIDHFIFMTGVYSATKSAKTSARTDFTEWRTTEPEQFKDWLVKMEPMDAEQYLRYKTVPALIQAAYKDEYLSDLDNELFIQQVPKPKRVRYYNATHALNENARIDRRIYFLQHP